VPSETSPSDAYEHPDDIAHNLRQLRIQVVSWQYGWGAENLWESEFNNQLSAAREEGQDAIGHFFFHNCETHAMQGMDVLKGLKFVAPVPCNSTPDEVRDLFLQGYDMVIGVASEVKFFEVKLDEYAPAIPMTKLSDIRHYSGM
jgi:hypothetical protein